MFKQNIWHFTHDKVNFEKSLPKFNGTKDNSITYNLSYKDFYVIILQANIDAINKGVEEFIIETAYDLNNFNVASWHNSFKVTISRLKSRLKVDGSVIGIQLPMPDIKIRPLYCKQVNHNSKDLMLLKFYISSNQAFDNENLKHDSIFTELLEYNFKNQHSILQLMLAKKYNEIDLLITAAKKENLTAEEYVKLKTEQKNNKKNIEIVDNLIDEHEDLNINIHEKEEELNINYPKEDISIDEYVEDKNIEDIDWEAKFK